MSVSSRHGLWREVETGTPASSLDTQPKRRRATARALDLLITTYIGPKNPEVARVGWSDETVWLNAAATKKGQAAKAGTIGFHGVSEAVWNFHIGGYQVCHKWLKDR